MLVSVTPRQTGPTSKIQHKPDLNPNHATLTA